MINSFSNYRKINYKKAPCPNCKLHIMMGTKCCDHCGHELTENELELLAHYVQSQKIKGIKIALVFFPVAFVLIYLLAAGSWLL